MFQCIKLSCTGGWFLPLKVDGIAYFTTHSWLVYDLMEMWHSNYQDYFAVWEGRGSILVCPKHMMFTTLGPSAAFPIKQRTGRNLASKGFQKVFGCGGWGIMSHNPTLGLLGHAVTTYNKALAQENSALKAQISWKISVDVFTGKTYTRSVISVLLCPAWTTWNQKATLTCVVRALPTGIETWLISLHDPKETGHVSSSGQGRASWDDLHVVSASCFWILFF